MEWHCPICRKPTNSETDKDFPFCSERCKLTDLGNWASEKYKISEPAHDESESASESAIGETTESATHSLSDSQEPRSPHGQTNGRRN